MARAPGFANIASAFRSPPFRDYEIGRFFAWIGSWTFRIALSWLVWELTHSSVWLGVIAFINLVPAAIIAPLTGALADRMNRVRLLSISQALLVVHGVALAVLVLMGLATIELLAFFALFHGVVDASQAAANHAVVPSLVPTRDLTAAYGINSMSFNLSRFIGPAIGGVVITSWGTGAAMIGNAIGAAIFLLALLRLKKVPPEIAERHDGRMLNDVADAVRYAARHEGLGPLLGMVTVMSLLSFHIYQFLPVFADPVFHAGADGLAWLIAIMGAGAILQSLYIAGRGGIEGLTANILRSQLLAGASILLLVATDFYWVGLVAMFLVGFNVGGIRVSSMTLLQHAVAGDMRGRVASFYSMISHVGSAIGALAIGWVAEWLGIRLTFAVCGVLCLGIWGWMMPKRRRMAAALERSG